MEQKHFLSLATIRKLFAHNNLERVTTVTPVKSGFRNNLHIINDKYVLKVCGAEANEPSFEKEAYFYKRFRGQIPVPHRVVFDKSKSQLRSFYMIYELIVGETLYARWSTYTAAEKEKVVQKLATILKVINEADYDDYLAKFDTHAHFDWKEERLTPLHSALLIVKQRRLLSAEVITSIEQYVEENAAALNQQKPGLTYWDLHFDNVLVLGSTVVGIIDFEGVGVMSIDYALDTLRRLSQYPEIYAPAEIDESVREHKAEYRHVFSLFKKYYPALFDFEKLDHRLNLYSIEYDLKLLEQFPTTPSLKARIQTYLPDGENKRLV